MVSKNAEIVAYGKLFIIALNDKYRYHFNLLLLLFSHWVLSNSLWPHELK